MLIQNGGTGYGELHGAHVTRTGLSPPCSRDAPYACGALRAQLRGARPGVHGVADTVCTKPPSPMYRTPLTWYNTFLPYCPDADSYGFLPLKLTFAAATFGDVSVSADMAKISPASNNT